MNSRSFRRTSVLAAVLAATLVACGGESATPTTVTATPAPAATATPAPAATATPTPVATTPTAAATTPTAAATGTPTTTATTTPTATATTTPTTAATTTPTTAATTTPTTAATTTPTGAATAPPTPTAAATATLSPEAIARALPQSPVVSAPPGPFTAIAVGGHQAACALTDVGELVCWDWGDEVATTISTDRHIDLDADAGTTCAVTAEGEVACWGADESAADAPPGDYKAVSTTDGYTCGLTGAGDVLCWGRHSERARERRAREGGAQSSGESSSYSGYYGRIPDPPPDSYVAVAVGHSDYLDGTVLSACAARAGGGFTCWRSSGSYGYDEERQIRQLDGDASEGLPSGDFCSVNQFGGPTCRSSRPYTAVSQGGNYACSITAEGEAECWASGVESALFGTFGLMTPPSPSSDRYAAISNADGRACALTETGEAVCWMAVPNVLLPPDPQPGSYVAVSDGRNHTCALTEAGQAVCWGWNNWGQSEAPPGRYTAISAGDFDTCALTEAGEEVCLGTFAARSFATGYVTCWLTDAGEAVCRGTDAPSGDYIALAVGWQHACALTDAGEAVCWAWASRRYDGYKEDSPTESPYHDELIQPPPGPFTAISASEFRTCALTRAGEVVCWGDVDYEQMPLWVSIE